MNDRQNNEIVEVREPLAHPHHPRRPAGAARPTFQVVAEAEEQEEVLERDRSEQ